MPLLNANDLGKSFGARDLFEHVSFSVPHRARIGLVGPNGVGKTTLFRLILGEEEPSRGTGGERPLLAHRLPGAGSHL